MSEVIYFYILFFFVLASSILVILTPRMYLAVFSLLALTFGSSLLYLTLNANYIAVFQFILCGLILSVFLFLLLKKIGRLNLKLKLVTPFKAVAGILAAVLFGGLSCLFFKQEFNNSLYSVFNYITEKSLDVVDFGESVFPLHLVLILLLVSAVVIRVFLSRQGEDS